MWRGPYLFDWVGKCKLRGTTTICALTSWGTNPHYPGGFATKVNVLVINRAPRESMKITLYSEVVSMKYNLNGGRHLPVPVAPF